MSVRQPERPGARVERELRERLAAMAPGEQFPPVGTLATEHRTSRATIQRVMHVLEAEGLVRIVSGWGSFRAGLGKRTIG